ncbi:MAG: DEAD/DEAH box helicase, partial [Propionicimonas sp.]
MTGFRDLGVRPELVAVLQRHDIVEPFPIQALSLPDALAGRDVLGRGRTGSGKTVAFSLPVVTRLVERGGRSRAHRPRALVLVPTRELAVQVNQTMAFLARAVGLRTMTVYGGVSYGPQLRRLEAGVDILIATPGRLEDLVERGACDLSEVGIAVLDEADLMADMGFLPAVMRLLRQTAPGGQRMLFSATLDRDVAAVVDAHLSDPVEHAVVAEEAPAIQHRVFLVTRENKLQVLADLVSGEGRSLVFARTKHGVARLARSLAVAGIPATELHGDLRQAARQRNLDDFASGRVRVLVATDVAARGIHVDDIALVVHSDPPTDPKAFLHRSGRTARAGASGVVVTLCQRDQN